jgi:prevent-host-death family protein
MADKGCGGSILCVHHFEIIICSPVGKAMQKVNVREARQQIGRLLDAVALGEEIVIMRHGKPAARLLPIPEDEAVRACFPDRSAVRARVPPAKLSAVWIIRELRDARG